MHFVILMLHEAKADRSFLISTDIAKADALQLNYKFKLKLTIIIVSTNGGCALLQLCNGSLRIDYCGNITPNFVYHPTLD